MDSPVRIAMWSGPRNISTAMMRSFEARGDSFVTDEPLYSHYLHETGKDHPMREEIIATYDHNWRNVVDRLSGTVPNGKKIWYQKHMSHHLLEHIDREWIKIFHNCFLIREPKEVLLSYSKKRERVNIEGLGYKQQSEIFEFIKNYTGQIPAVIDARDVLEDPRKILQLLCEHIGIDFTEDMLEWKPGLRETDGIWAKHWYDAVKKTTGFEKYQQKTEELLPEFDSLLVECREYYNTLWEVRLGR